MFRVEGKSAKALQTSTQTPKATRQTIFGPHGLPRGS